MPPIVGRRASRGLRKLKARKGSGGMKWHEKGSESFPGK
jgi:hypothetical protein